VSWKRSAMFRVSPQACTSMSSSVMMPKSARSVRAARRKFASMRPRRTATVTLLAISNRQSAGTTAHDLGAVGNAGYGAIGGVVGALILQALIPALRGIDYGPIVGQLIVAAASGAILTIIAGAVTRWRQNR
jgi:hypothetical protein